MSKIAIANRGEVAVRIHRAIKKLGHQSLLLHSEPDQNSTAFRLCDETACVGPGPSLESYLNIENVIAAAKSHGAKALHPGFGFLSENAEFARACHEAGIIFIGPSPESMELFGDKISAKDFCEKNQIPTLKSYRGVDQSLETLKAEASQIGYPVLIKAAAGGGGRGMRVVHQPTDFKDSLDSAQNEARKAFGSELVFLEKYLEKAKHIEVQIFGTPEETFVLGERECSVQRRHQKIIEEALSPSLNQSQRDEVHSYARTLCSQAQYQGAGTVEFLFSEGQFYFLEVNTRLQVEHPVTEEVFGVDLVCAQINLALSHKLDQNFSKLHAHGHSIECRVYAESLKGLPSIGKIGTLELGEATHPGLRLEQGFERHDEITSFYDSMIAKVIVTEKDRTSCIKTLVSILKSSVITGVETNIPLLIKILEHPDFKAATMQTDFFETHFKEGLDFPFEVPSLIPRKEAPSSLFESQKKGSGDFFVERLGEKTWFSQEGWSLCQNNSGYFRLKQKVNRSINSGSITAPMPGQILKILVSENQKVKEGESLFIVEAMKMEHSLKAPFEGLISQINFKVGDAVGSDDVILEVKR